MKNISLFIVLCGILLFSCTKQRMHGFHHGFKVEELVVNTKQMEGLDTGQYVISKILPLKCDEGVILPQYDKIVFQEGKIYVMDKEVTKGVVVFDSLGNYKNKL